MNNALVMGHLEAMSYLLNDAECLWHWEGEAMLSHLHAQRPVFCIFGNLVRDGTINANI